VIDNFNVRNFNIAGGMPPLESDSMGRAFFEWLSDGHAKKYTPSICLSCIDKISEYAREKRISAVNIQNITKHGVLKSIC
jgi:hypothetical protein